MAPRLSGTVTKALDLLDCFTAARNDWSATAMAAATGIHKSTVVRLCATLAARGYLQRTSAGTYRVGASVRRLGEVYSAAFDLETRIRPLLADLRDRTGESASFYVRDGEERVCRYRASSRHAIRHHVDEGARLPLTKGVVGRVIAAFDGQPGRDYAGIRERGYLDAEGREPLTASVAVPLLDAAGHAHGAIVVSGPSERFTLAQRQRALRQLKTACATLRELLPVPATG